MYNNQNTKNKFAFSLIELMVSLIVVSCIIACFAPVITKKLGHSVKVGVSQLSEITNKCDEFGEDCKLCYKGKKCIMCEKICADGEYKDNEQCTCNNCADNSEGCLECDDSACKKCNIGYGLDSDSKKCVPCQAGSYSKEASNRECAKCPVDNFCTGGEHIQKCALNEGAFEGSAECNPCSLKCLECDVPNACLKCESGYYLDEGVCAPCPAGYRCDGVEKSICSMGQYAAQTSSVCQACGIGKGSIAGSSSCFDCSVGCAKCSSATVCTGCKTGFRLNDKVCERVVNEGCGEHCQAGKCSSASNTCSQCDGVSYRNNTGGCSPRCKLNPDPVSACSIACAEKGSAYSGGLIVSMDTSGAYLQVNDNDMFCDKNKCNSYKVTDDGKAKLICKCASGSAVANPDINFDESAHSSCGRNCIACKQDGSVTCNQCAAGYFLDSYGTSCMMCQCSEITAYHLCSSCSADDGCCDVCQQSGFMYVFDNGIRNCYSRCMVKGDTRNPNGGREPINYAGTRALCDEFCKNKGYLGQISCSSTYTYVDQSKGSSLWAPESARNSTECKLTDTDISFHCRCLKSDGTSEVATPPISSVELYWYTGS